MSVETRGRAIGKETLLLQARMEPGTRKDRFKIGEHRFIPLVVLYFRWLQLLSPSFSSILKATTPASAAITGGDESYSDLIIL